MSNGNQEMEGQQATTAAVASHIGHWETTAEISTRKKTSIIQFLNINQIPVHFIGKLQYKGLQRYMADSYMILILWWNTNNLDPVFFSLVWIDLLAWLTQ